MPTIKLGELLVRANVLQENQLKAALVEQRRWGGRLGEILVRMSVLTEDMLVRALAKQLNLPTMNLDAIKTIPGHIKVRVPLKLARDLQAVPLEYKDGGKSLAVAMTDPQNIEQIDTLRLVAGMRISPQVASASAIRRAIARFYAEEGAAPLIDDEEPSFKVIDSQGHTVVKKKPTREETSPTIDVNSILELDAPKVAPPKPATPTAAPASTGQTASTSASSLAQMQQILDAQRREGAMLKAMIELLIEKGVITRDEYLSKMKRTG